MEDDLLRFAVDRPEVDSVDPREVDSTMSVLQGANRKPRIAVNRWWRSMTQDAELENRYIDLRIALEAIWPMKTVDELCNSSDGVKRQKDSILRSPGVQPWLPLGQVSGQLLRRGKLRS